MNDLDNFYSDVGDTIANHYINNVRDLDYYNNKINQIGLLSRFEVDQNGDISFNTDYENINTLTPNKILDLIYMLFFNIDSIFLNAGAGANYYELIFFALTDFNSVFEDYDFPYYFVPSRSQGLHGLYSGPERIKIIQALEKSKI